MNVLHQLLFFAGCQPSPYCLRGGGGGIKKHLPALTPYVQLAVVSGRRDQSTGKEARGGEQGAGKAPVSPGITGKQYRSNPGGVAVGYLNPEICNFPPFYRHTLIKV